jgi:imidazolonepropionase-like amidohydrolase
VDGTRSGPAGPTYSPRAVEAMTAAVHAAGRRVAAHVTTDAVAHLVRAGVDSVEHGTALDESTLRLMAQAGTAACPGEASSVRGSCGAEGHVSSCSRV